MFEYINGLGPGVVVYLKLTAKQVAKSMRNSAHRSAWLHWLGSLYIIAVDITSRIQGTPKRICIICGLNSMDFFY